MLESLCHPKLSGQKCKSFKFLLRPSLGLSIFRTLISDIICRPVHSRTGHVFCLSSRSQRACLFWRVRRTQKNVIPSKKRDPWLHEVYQYKTFPLQEKFPKESAYTLGGFVFIKTFQLSLNWLLESPYFKTKTSQNNHVFALSSLSFWRLAWHLTTLVTRDEKRS